MATPGTAAVAPWRASHTIIGGFSQAHDPVQGEHVEAPLQAVRQALEGVRRLCPRGGQRDALAAGEGLQHRPPEGPSGEEAVDACADGPAIPRDRALGDAVEFQGWAAVTADPSHARLVAADRD